MTHPDPHQAIGATIVQLRRNYDAAGERNRAAYEARFVHVEPPLFDYMMSPGELLAAVNVWLVRLAIFAAGWMVGCITAALMVGGLTCAITPQ